MRFRAQDPFALRRAVGLLTGQMLAKPIRQPLMMYCDTLSAGSDGPVGVAARGLDLFRHRVRRETRPYGRLVRRSMTRKNSALTFALPLP